MIRRSMIFFISLLFLVPGSILMNSDAGEELETSPDTDRSEMDDITRAHSRYEDEWEWDRTFYPSMTGMGKYGLCLDRNSGKLFAVNLYNNYQDPSPVFEYDFSNDEWIESEEIDRPDLGRDPNPIVNMDSGIIYMYGGYQNANYKNDLYSYDTNTGQWNHLRSNLLSKPVMWSGVVCSPRMDSIFIHSGQSDQAHGGGVVDGFYRISTNSPYTATALNSGASDGMAPRRYHSLCIDEINGTIYSIGGYGNSQFRELWQYNIKADSWAELEVPSQLNIDYDTDRIFFNPRDRSLNIIESSAMNFSLWSYFPSTGNWEHRTSMVAFSGSCEICFDGQTGILYFTDNNMNNILKLDMDPWQVNMVSLNRHPGATNDYSLMFERNGEVLYLGEGSDHALYPYNENNGTWGEPRFIENGTRMWDLWQFGTCYMEDLDSIFVLGGRWENLDYSEMYRIDLERMRNEFLGNTSEIGKFCGASVVYNPDDGFVYAYGGYQYLGPDQLVYFDNFFRIDPMTGDIFQLDNGQVNPGKRYGVSMIYRSDSKQILLYGGDTGTRALNDLWTYDISRGIWSQVEVQGATPPRKMFGNMFVDEKMNDLYVFGGCGHVFPINSYFQLGTDDAMYRLGLISNRWERVYTETGAIEHLKPGFFFKEDERRLMIFGINSRSLWQTTIPLRSKIIDTYLLNPRNGENNAYSQYENYNVKTQLFTPGGESDISTVSLKLPSARGNVYLNYSVSDEVLTEYDPLELVDVISVHEDWNGNILDLYYELKFNWNFSSPSEGNTYIIDVSRYDGKNVELYKTDVVRVRNKMTLDWDGCLECDRGEISSGDWINAGGNITVKDLSLNYKGTSLQPPAGSIDFDLICKGMSFACMSNPSDHQFDVSFPVHDYLQGKLDFTMDFGWLNDIIESEVDFSLRVDSIAPTPPIDIKCYPDEINITEGIYDNDRTLYFKWLGSVDMDSGIGGFYYSTVDNGGTADGNYTRDFFAEVEFPSRGTFDLYIWPVDVVGNIGNAESIKVHIDDLPIEFKILSPDLDLPLPQCCVELEVQMEDDGGSDIETRTVQYRFSNNGIEAISWVGADAWKDVTAAWADERLKRVNFRLELNELSREPNNMVQFRAKDGGGTMYYSDVFYPMVDGSILNPISTLIGPENGAEFEYDDDIYLNWTVASHYPERIVYDLYLSENEELVKDLDPAVLFEVNLLEAGLKPTGLEYGTYFWDVVPVFDGTSRGTCANGPYSFKVRPEGGGSLELDTTIVEGKFQLVQGGDEGYISFEVYNPGPLDLDVDISITAPDDVTVIPGNKNPTETARIKRGQTMDLSFRISASEDLEPGNYDLTINISSIQGPSIERTYTFEVLEGKDAGAEDKELPSSILVLGIVGLLLTIIVLAAFLIIRTRKKEVPQETLQHDEIDDELEKQEEMEREIQTQVPPPKQMTEKELIHEVPSNFKEAHEHDRDKKKISYEALYGRRMIDDVHPDMTTEELRDFISEKAEELEGLDIPEDIDDLEDLLSHMERSSEDIVHHGLFMESEEIELRSAEDPYDHQGEIEDDRENGA